MLIIAIASAEVIILFPATFRSMFVLALWKRRDVFNLTGLASMDIIKRSSGAFLVLQQVWKLSLSRFIFKLNE